MNYLVARFLRAFGAGASASMIALLTCTNCNNWSDVQTWLSALTISGVIGGISGLIMAVDKYFRSLADY